MCVYIYIYREREMYTYTSLSLSVYIYIYISLPQESGAVRRRALAELPLELDETARPELGSAGFDAMGFHR